MPGKKLGRQAAALERQGYSPTEIAEILGCSRSKVYMMIQSGELRARRLGGRMIVLATDLERSLQKLPVA
jgi:excisionase family DNA binding protein